ncbi:MAG: hypothetical protein A2X25_04240 [Chloroflexi bacterium GWB2_49_20]|nr:MAG: hypothetical protein A2X25_04240 [Chloroflexi bacterium GWB2_49_20]OGN77882.1 MAG: hypothetical protein A2X26_01970 [Chloroflexi bacterium GWC2_49_37]OGN82737.1 MAG: hypothetical protein A2X27_09060 [Chloroflexi bacterium GWD2_49_16]HCM96131.1 hypothetical protein [Anaerolineae bacterium]
MTKRNRTHLALGVILILLAIGLLILKANPSLAEYIHVDMSWPAWIIIGGGVFLLFGLLVGEPDMAIPASIFAGVGSILYYQNAYQDFSSWAYMWTLIPGFAGLGNVLAGFFGASFRKSISEGFRLIFISIIMFLIFASVFGKLEILGPNKEFILAGILLLFGVWLIIRGLIRPQAKE